LEGVKKWLETADETRMRLVAIVAAIAAALALSGCGGTASLSGGGSIVRVTERDFKITAPKQVAAGDVTLQIANRGPDAHELIVVRTDKTLPIRTDGLTVDEDAVQHSEAGALEPAHPGVHELKVHLSPGRYILLCNMEGHYMGGMHAVLVVH
jgi:uncharacterized cupredoxin-like copper-binding protein